VVNEAGYSSAFDPTLNSGIIVSQAYATNVRCCMSVVRPIANREAGIPDENESESFEVRCQFLPCDSM